MKKHMKKRKNRKILNTFKIINCNIFTGIALSSVNIIESDITQGVELALIENIIAIYAIIFILRFFLRTAEKELRNDILNDDYIEYASKAVNSSPKVVQETSVGAIFDAVKDLSREHGTLVVDMISTIPMIIPSFVLIYKEFMYRPIVGVITILSMAITFLISNFADKLFAWNTKAKEIKAKLQSITADNFQNIMTIKFMGFEDFAINRLRNAQVSAEPYFVPRKKYAWFRLVDITNTSALIAAIWLCRQNISMVALIIMATYNVSNLSSHLAELADLKSEIDSQKKILNGLDGEDTVETRKDFDAEEGAIVLDNVKFGYKPTEGCTEYDVTFWISLLVICYRKRYLIRGKSGEGKSALLDLIAGINKPSNGKTLNKYNVFYVSQKITALNDTLWNNIVGSNEYGVTEEEVLELLDDVKLLDWFNKLSMGFETQLGEHGCHLSFGQMQRVNAIRMALAMRYTPNKIFLIDEITSNLDDESRDAILNLIDRECHSTALIVAHDDGYENIVDDTIIVENHVFKHRDSVLDEAV